MPRISSQNPKPAPALARTQPSPRKLGLIPLVCVMYLVVSGGAYGLEDAVRMAGPRLTLLLCLVVPLTLSLPTALMAAELTALMPVEGGFYFWVKEALGPFAGFAEAYLTILYTAFDMAIYPVLFASYLSFILPLGPSAKSQSASRWSGSPEASIFSASGRSGRRRSCSPRSSSRRSRYW